MVGIKKWGIAVGSLVFFSGALSAKPGSLVPLKEVSKKIIVTVPWDSPREDGVFITGNISELCKWEPNCLQMTETAPHIFEATISVSPTIKGFYFKITRGAWKLEATDGMGRAPENAYFDTTQPEMVYSVIDWKDRTNSPVTGKLQIHRNFYSPQLNNSRSLRVWLPPSYNLKRGNRYPVIYMHDGQNLFDPETSNSGRSDWNVDQTMSQLILKNEVPEAIIVGIDCTSARFDEYDWRRSGQAYGDFLVNTVKPWIDAKYRTLPTREHTYLMGSSMGAIISFSILWFHPEVFSRAGSPSLPTFANYDTIFHTVANTQKPSLPFKVMMTHGTVKGDVGYAPGCQGFYKMMREQFRVTEEELVYKVYPYADHFEADWARQMPDLLKFLLN